MKNPSRYVAAAVLTLVFSGPAIAHDDGRYSAYPGGAWSGSATIYVNSQGVAGWGGTLGYNAAYPVVPVYAPRVVAVPPPQLHGPACGHSYPYARSYRKGHRHPHDRGHPYDRGYRDGKRH